MVIAAPLIGAVLKNDFLLNDDTTGMCKHSFTGKTAVALSNNGNFVVTWIDERDGDSLGDIYAQVFNNSGQRLGVNFRVNEDSSVERRRTPVAVMDNSGAFLVVWLSSSGFFCQMFDSTGASQGSNVSLGPKSSEPQPYIGGPSVVGNGSDSGSYYLVYNGYTSADGLQVHAEKFTRNGYISDSWELSKPGIGCGSSEFPAVAMNKSGKVIVAWNDDFPFPYNQGIPQDVYAERLDSAANVTGDIFRVNEDTTGNQGIPSVGIDSSGKYVAVWQDNRNGSYQIYGRMYTNRGIPFGPSFKISDVGGDNTNPEIAMNGAGFFAVVWENDQDGNIYCQRFFSTGLRIGGNFRVNATTKTIQNNPTIALNDSNQLVIAWQDTTSSHPNLIRAQVYDPNGSPLLRDEDLIVNDDEGSCNQGYRGSINLAMNKKGNAVVFWDDERNYADQFYGQVLDPEGNPVGKNFQIGEGFSVDIQYPPGVAMDSSGNFVVSWTTTDSIVYAQRFDNTGNPRGTPMPVNWGSGANRFLTGSSVGCDAVGNFIVVWGTFSTLGNNICGQFYDKTSRAVGGNIYIDDDPNDQIKNAPCVAMNPAGASIVGWLDNRDNSPDPTPFGNIYAQLITASRSRLGVNFQVDSAGSNMWLQHGPSVAIDDAGNCVVMWQRRVYGVWVQRYDNQGKPVGGNFPVGGKNPSFSSVAIDSAGRFIGVWNDKGEVIARRFNSDGTAWGTEEKICNSKQLPYQARSAGYRAVAANSDKILFVWIDNPRHKGWDVYAKITDWNLTGIAEGIERRAKGKTLTVLPNPARNTFQIDFTQTKSGLVSLRMYDASGSTVKTLIDDHLKSGHHSLRVSAKDLPQGIYFIHFASKNFQTVRKIVLLR
jgi:hypothetical protein